MVGWSTSDTVLRLDLVVERQPRSPSPSLMYRPNLLPLQDLVRSELICLHHPSSLQQVLKAALLEKVIWKSVKKNLYPHLWSPVEYVWLSYWKLCETSQDLEEQRV